MVPVGGLQPPRPKATDFESVVYTNFTIPALSGGYCPFDAWHYTYAYECRKYKNLKLRVFADNFATKL